MLINADSKNLEWVSGTFLSRCPVATKEWLDGEDQHTSNQKQFGLPDRGLAKIFVFRLIYGGSAYSYSSDPQFRTVSGSTQFWQKVIDGFYDKYVGWAKWHQALMQEATTTGKLVMPTGRIHEFKPYEKNGDWKWPRTTILNYPVQGLGADLMAIARVSFRNRWRVSGIKGVLVSSVHDSIVVDVEPQELDKVARLMTGVFDDIPKNFQKLFGVPFNLPMRVEIQYGNNLLDMKTWGVV